MLTPARARQIVMMLTPEERAQLGRALRNTVEALVDLWQQLPEDLRDRVRTEVALTRSQGTHMLDAGGRTACGLPALPELLTEEQGRVTCRLCLEEADRQAEEVARG